MDTPPSTNTSPASKSLNERIKYETNIDLDDLLEQIRVVGEERAKLRAYFYASATNSTISDELRKQLKSKCVKKIVEQNPKISISLAETLAYSDPEYMTFIESLAQKRIEYETIDARYHYLEYQLEVAKQKLYFAKLELAYQKP